MSYREDPKMIASLFKDDRVRVAKACDYMSLPELTIDEKKALETLGEDFVERMFARVEENPK